MDKKYNYKTCSFCGLIRNVRSDNRSYKCKKCHINILRKLEKKIIDLTDQKFGKLTVIQVSHKTKRGVAWNCKCDCGNIHVVLSQYLRSGATNSCGCLTSSKKCFSSSPEYRSYKAMIQRCYDTKNLSYKRYGAKGIKVCAEWEKDFFSFLRDMGEKPEGYTLDRINSLGNYEKENCRWATPQQQANNRFSNFLITYNDKTQTLTQWANEYGLHWATLRKRIISLKWDIHKAITTKVKNHEKKS